MTYTAADAVEIAETSGVFDPDVDCARLSRAPAQPLTERSRAMATKTAATEPGIRAIVCPRGFANEYSEYLLRISDDAHMAQLQSWRERDASDPDFTLREEAINRSLARDNQDAMIEQACHWQEFENADDMAAMAANARKHLPA